MFKIKFSIERLPYAEQSGDWHDKPVRWTARTETPFLTQKFPTRKEAELWARLCRKHGNFSDACHAFIAI